jgi:hypothetical protein
VVALAGDLDFVGSSFLAGLTAVLVAGLRHATAWQVRTFILFVGCHRCSSFRMLFVEYYGEALLSP